MKIQLVRHATLVIELDDTTLLVDPMLGDVGEFQSFLPTSPPNSNPVVPLPTGLDLPSILSPVKTVFVTHTHPDHFDDAAVDKLLPKDKDGLHIYCQPQPPEDHPEVRADEVRLRERGFSSVQPVEDKLQVDGVEVFRTDGQHGPNNQQGDGTYIGPVSGFVLSSQNEPTLYIAGDTIFCQEVKDALDTYKPDIVVVNAGAAQIPEGSLPITMCKEDVCEVCKYLPSAPPVIAVHMEALDHCLEHRKDLQDYIDSKGLSAQACIPVDGQKYTWSSGALNPI